MGACSPKPVEPYIDVAREPGISPAYSGATIPANIAPLDFRVLEEGRTYSLTVRSDRGRPITLFSRTGQMCLPIRQWRTLLEANRGRDVFFDICVEGADRQWRRYQSIVNTIAREDIDQTLVFRLMKPVFNWWEDIGIYQRDLTSFEASPILENHSFGYGCLNCHSFQGNDPKTMSIALRSATYGTDTLLARNGAVEKVHSKWGYTAWHPGGTVAMYSVNKTIQFFHAGGMQVRDVADLESSLVCYRVEAQTVSSPMEIADTNRLQTYPAWSPDGKSLYFCSAPILWKDSKAVPPKNYDKLKYDLRRVSYDVAADRWGQVETVLSAEETGQSILLPRVSPDGRFLVFCMCGYGCFPVYQPSSDLYLMDLSTRQYRKLAINSGFSESWHSWSSNSRWLAFSSKRGGGLFTRTYISYVDDTGEAHKPFILPQQDPRYYDSLLETYSVPELLKGPVVTSESALSRAACASPPVKPETPRTGANPQSPPFDPRKERS